MTCNISALREMSERPSAGDDGGGTEEERFGTAVVILGDDCPQKQTFRFLQQNSLSGFNPNKNKPQHGILFIECGKPPNEYITIVDSNMRFCIGVCSRNSEQYRNDLEGFLSFTTQQPRYLFIRTFLMQYKLFSFSITFYLVVTCNTLNKQQRLHVEQYLFRR